MRDLVAEDTWFFVGGPAACKHVCSRECLVRFAAELLGNRPPGERQSEASVTRLKRGAADVVYPQRSD